MWTGGVSKNAKLFRDADNDFLRVDYIAESSIRADRQS